MVIHSSEKNYEVLQQLSRGGAVSHYLCHEQGAEPEVLWDVAEFCQPGIIDQVILMALELKENPAFGDFSEYFPDEGRVYLVFSYLEGQSLAMETVELLPAETRFSLVQKVLEKLVLMNLPVFLQWEVLQPEHVRVSWMEGQGEPETEIGFFYELGDLKRLGEIAEQDVWDRLGPLIELLFQEELEKGYYSELEAFLKALGAGDLNSVMEVYQAWLLLLPVLTEVRGPKKVVKESWIDRLKKRQKQVMTAVKLILAVVVVVNAVLVVMAGWKENIFPLIESRYLVKTMAVDSKSIKGYNGRVKLVKPGTDQVIWKGTMEEGALNGYGIQYYENGNVEYEGMLAAGTYSGQGIFYDRNGTVLYEGEFLDGVYNGNGKLYDKQGNLRYQGGFALGEKEGNGSCYDQDGGLIYEGGYRKGRYEGEGLLYQDGQLVYEGGFKQGKADGAGVYYDNGRVAEEGTYKAGKLEEGSGALYDEDGVLCYQGGLADGKRSGEGQAFEHGILVYEGIFTDDAYGGEGKLYSPSTGGLVYEGGFVRGEYSGAGTYYEPVSGIILYAGNFRLGMYDGEGKEYDGQGNLVYEGEFRLGSRNGAGILYDGATGMVVQEGIFRDGVLVTSKEALEAAAGADGAGEEADGGTAQEEAETDGDSGAGAEAEAGGGPGAGAEAGGGPGAEAEAGGEPGAEAEAEATDRKADSTE